MAANPITQEQPKKVIFACAKHPTIKIVHKHSESLAVWEDGKQVIHNTPQKMIVFKNGLYETTDPDEINFLRNYALTTGRTPEGRVAPQIIKELVGPDPNQQRYYQMLQQVGPQNIVAAVEKAYGIQTGIQIQDPVKATLDQRSGVTNSGSINQ